MRVVPGFLSAVLLAGLTAQAALFTTEVHTPIPDGNPGGLQSVRTLSGLGHEITDVNVVLNISGGYTGDLYAYLSHENGGFAVLLNRVGRTAVNPFGYWDAGFTISLDDASATDIHLYGGNGGATVTGDWQPDGRSVNPQLVVDTDSRTAMLSSFDGLNPNGAWTLFVADMSGASGFSTLESWSLEVQAVPEPVNVAFALFAGIFGLFSLIRTAAVRSWFRQRFQR